MGEKTLNKIIGAIVLILIVFLIFSQLKAKVNFDQITDVEYLKNTLSQYENLAPIIFIAIMAIAIIISPIPSLPLDIAAGAIWGPFIGGSLAIIGAEIGAIISFLIARYLGRELVEKLLHKDIHICDNCSEKYIFWVILIARLFPFFQFDIISYGAGLTNISVKKFAVATFIGMIPMTYLFAYTGKAFFSAKLLSTFLSIVIIGGMFIVPMLINRYNIFNLKDKIKL
tara:strand:+ start:740 stop:1420 length:681 start_codon:yes stop_codon:yes gene_type:complete